ncbi:hypothetical protein SFRURICE_008743 [Spodoptera frugiperda]|nr:hypothetical protein SFRURICE_008743 [Spodoptera frugiperda]
MYWIRAIYIYDVGSSSYAGQSASQPAAFLDGTLRVPRGARASVASSLARCIALVARENSPSAWEQLLTFPFRILHVQKDLASKKTLTTQIKDNCFLKTQPFDPKLPVHFSHKGLLHHVESKLADGDIRGAARVLFSSDVVAAYSAETVTALQTFLSSVHSTSELVRKILSPSLASFEVPCLTDAVEAWKMACPLTDLPVHPSSQRQWDVPLCSIIQGPN